MADVGVDVEKEAEEENQDCGYVRARTGGRRSKEVKQVGARLRKIDCQSLLFLLLHYCLLSIVRQGPNVEQ